MTVHDYIPVSCLTLDKAIIRNCTRSSDLRISLHIIVGVVISSREFRLYTENHVWVFLEKHQLFYVWFSPLIAGNS
jgi:hypothetical protein